jgi:hypothetical protein
MFTRFVSVILAIIFASLSIATAAAVHHPKKKHHPTHHVRCVTHNVSWWRHHWRWSWRKKCHSTIHQSRRHHPHPPVPTTTSTTSSSTTSTTTTTTTPCTCTSTTNSTSFSPVLPPENISPPVISSGSGSTAQLASNKIASEVRNTTND